MNLSHKVSILISNSKGNHFSRRGISNLPIDSSISLDYKCMGQCTHIHGRLEVFNPEPKIKSLDELDRLPSLRVLSKAEDLLKKATAGSSVVWDGYFVGAYSKDDISVLKGKFRRFTI